MSLFLIVALPFLGALLPGLMIRAGRQACGLVTFLVTLTAFLGLMTHLPTVMAGETVTARLDWMPALGLNFTLMLDGLGFFFALLILGIGLLIIVFLIAEPHGLAQLWRVAKEKLRLWPFPH